MAGGLEADIDAIMDRAVNDRQSIVGAVIKVARHGRIVYSRAAGFADREAGSPVTVGTIFRFASLTKPIVAATILAQSDRGLIALDDPVTKALPWFRPKLGDGTEPVITIKHLLTHASGLVYAADNPSDNPYARAGVSDGIQHAEITLEENLRRLASAPLAFAPGTQWRYSMATDVLGGVAAALEGGSLYDAVKRNVLDPLSLSTLAFSFPDDGRVAAAYCVGPDRPKRMDDPQYVTVQGDNGFLFSPGRIFDPTQFQSGGAGMGGTAGEFLTFLETLRASGAPVLKGETLRAATQNQIGNLQRDTPGMKFGYFGGVVDDPAAAGVRYGKGSFEWGGVYGNSWFVDPARGISAVGLTNVAFEGGGPFFDEIRDAIYDNL